MKKGWLAALLLLAMPVHAEKLPLRDFTVPPQLVRAATSNYSSTYDYADYTFEIVLPADVGLAQLAIAFPEGVSRIALPEPGNVKVLNDQGQSIPAEVVLQDRTVKINFPQPPSAGQKVSVIFSWMRNPRIGGAYLFGVSASPVGNPERVWFLNYGRITFYEPSR